MTAYTLSFVDRSIIALLVVPIKADLNLTDVQISLLLGFAFAIFYTLFGIPIAKLADSASRKSIIVIGVFFWSLMTAACGLARSFGGLFLARVGVGIGEATLSPAAYSIISDYFPTKRLATALGVYQLGIPFGVGLAAIFGGFVIDTIQTIPSYGLGVLGEIRTWQLVFLIVGSLGAPVLLLVMTIREPRRRTELGATARQQGGPPDTPPFREVLRFIGRHWQVYAPHFGGYALSSMMGYGLVNWLPTFLVRHHQMEISSAAYLVGIANLVFGTGGNLAAGVATDFLGVRGKRDAPMRVSAYGAIGVIAAGIALPFVPSGPPIWLVLAAITFFHPFMMGPAPVALQLVTPNLMRARVSSIWLFVMNMIGLGLGPTAVALFTDYVFKDETAVGFSIASITAICIPLAFAAFVFSMPHYRDMNQQSPVHQTA